MVFAAATRYDLAPGEVTCEFDLDLRATREPPAEWAFAPSAGLRVLDVTVNNRAGWRTDAATNELRVSLRQPAAAAKVRVTAAAAMPTGPGAPAALPVLRPVNGLPTQEQVDLHVAAGLDLAGWEPGDFRVTDAATAADGARTLALTGTLMPAGAAGPARRPPAVRVADAGPLFDTTEDVTWEAEPGRTHLTAAVRVRVRRGPLFRLTARPPHGYAFGRAATDPADALATAGPGPAGAVTVEFSRPLVAGQELKLTLEFRGPAIPPGPVARLPFPGVGLLGAAERQGSVRGFTGPGWEAHPRVVRPPDVPEPVPAGADPRESFHVRYAGAEPAGDLLLTSVRVAFASSVDTQFDFTDGQLTATSVVRIDVSSGFVGAVAVCDPGGAAARAWKVTDGSTTVAAATPTRLGGLPACLALLGGNGLGQLAAVSAAGRVDPGTLWLVRFSRPVEDGLLLETAAVLGTGLTHAEARRRAASWGGLTVAGAAERTSRTDLPAALGGGPPAAARPEWVVGDLVLTTECGEHDQSAALRGVVTVRGGRELPIRLPAGATARAATVGGKAVDTASLAGTEVMLPVPAGNESAAFEVRYRLPREPRGIAWKVDSELPELPGGAGPRREWVFEPGVAAAWPFEWPEAGAVVVVPSRLATAAGLGLAALLGGLGWAGVRTAHRSAGFALITALAGAGVAVLAGPAAWACVGWPVLAVGLPAAAAVVVSRGRLPRRAMASATLLVAAGASAQPGGADVVFVLAGADGETVLAPPALLARLEALAKAEAPAPVVVAATYDGRVEDGLARVTAAFTVQALAPTGPPVQLPLADVRLERVTVNGAAANPAAVGGGRYAVPLPGAGRHAVEVRYAVPVGGGGGEREVRFGVPEAPDARLTFAAPAAARQVQAVGRFGEQKSAGDPTRIAAELGAIKAVSVRWRDTPGGAGTVTVREGCVWDVSESGAVLTACYDIRAEAAAAGVFRFDLPAGLEPVRVAARGLDPAAGAAAVQAWVVTPEKGGGRTLRVDLAAPADGRVLVTVECHTRAAPAAQPVLRFPRPQGMGRSGGVYGLRPNNVTVGDVPRVGVIDFAPDALVREFGTVPELRLALVPGLQAFIPQPDGAAPELRPVLRAGPDAGTARVEAAWGADLRRAAGAGSLAWSAAEPVALLEFALAARVREVRAAELAGWSQSGEQVQVWFRRPVPAGTVHWVADVALNPVGADAVVFEPPLPRPVGPATVAAAVRVRPADGLGLKLEAANGWTPDRAGGGREWGFKAPAAAAPVRVRLLASNAGRPAGFGLLDLTTKEPTYRVAVELPVAAGRPAHVVVRAAGLPAEAVAELELPPGSRVAARARRGDVAAWDVDAPAGSFRAVVVVRFPAGWAGPLPAVWAGTGDAAPGDWDAVRFVGRVGRPDVRLSRATAATPIEQAEAGANWPGEVERLRRTGGELFTTPGPVAVELPAPPSPPSPPIAPATSLPAVAPAVPATGPPPGSGQAAGWVLGLVVVGVLFARLPRATWPEQAAALAALFGHAVAGVPFVGLGVFAAARAVWFVDRWKASRPPSGGG